MFCLELNNKQDCIELASLPTLHSRLQTGRLTFDCGLNLILKCLIFVPSKYPVSAKLSEITRKKKTTPLLKFLNGLAEDCVACALFSVPRAAYFQSFFF